ncbi:hypothetical protein AB9F45_28850 [Rhizobium leguminosarum]
MGGQAAARNLFGAIEAGIVKAQNVSKYGLGDVDVSPDSPHEKYAYIRTPIEPQKMSGASIIPATIILVTAKLRAPPRMPKQPIASMASCYGHEVRDGSDLGLGSLAPISA